MEEVIVGWKTTDHSLPLEGSEVLMLTDDNKLVVCNFKEYFGSVKYWTYTKDIMPSKIGIKND